MAIDFKIKFKELSNKDVAPLNEQELGLVKLVEDYIDSKILKDLNTDSNSIWIEKNYVCFKSFPNSKNNGFINLTNARRDFLKRELLSRYENANWRVSWHIDDGLDGNMSGGDYLILTGIKG